MYHHRVKFIRPDLYQGQPCQGDEPYTLFAPVNYYECIIPAKETACPPFGGTASHAQIFDVGDSDFLSRRPGTHRGTGSPHYPKSSNLISIATDPLTFFKRHGNV